jgi:N-methylhydantoinase B/oxoprolinase/acetone carboxylase alpha subunit
MATEKTAAAESAQADIFTYEVLRSLMNAIPLEMAEVLKRTSYHPIFNEVLDFSTALFSRKGELIGQAGGVSVHLGALETCLGAVIDHFGAANLKPDDVLMHNNPFPGGTHLPDVDIVVPVFHENHLVAFSVSRGHHGDIGGANPGSFAGDSTSIFQEGVRMPPLKLYDGGVLNEGIRDLLLANVRVPTFTWGDLQAQIAGARIGEQRLQEMFAKHGEDLVNASVEWAMDASEKLIRAKIEEIPDGSYPFEDYLDNDGIDMDRPVKVRCTVIVKGSDIIFDYTGSDPQVKGPANCVKGVAYSASYMSLFYLTDKTIPINHGCYRPVTVIAPEGSVVNAKFPSPVVSGNTETSERIVDIIIAALGRIMPEKVTGSDSGTCTAHIAGGFDPRNGEYYAWYIGSDPTAWGARATKDGFQAAGGPRIGGSVSQVPMEVFETRYPYIVTEYAYQTDSGGPGKFRGGISGVTVMKPVGHEVVMGGACDRCFIPPYGIFGGMPGHHGDNYVERKNGERVPLNRAGGVPVYDGDTVYFKVPGGGGYGSPLERDLGHLQHDLDNEYVSVEAAERDYGAVVAATGQIDRPATEKKRARLKAEWKREEIYIDQATLPYARTPFRIVKMTDEL